MQPEPARLRHHRPCHRDRVPVMPSLISHGQRQCLAALAKQSLILIGTTWRGDHHRHCGFSHQTIQALVQRGLAMRIGNRVIGMLGVNDNGVGK
jgi:hypothetical protein